MKKALIAMACLAFVSSPFCLKAQDVKTDTLGQPVTKEKVKTKEKSASKQTQEIVIRNKEGKDLELKIEVKGDKVTINGKPLEEFKDEGVTIDNRRMYIRDRDVNMTYNFGPEGMTLNKDFMGWGGKDVSGAFLGVT